MKHIHHKIPKHMGGTDEEDNLEELTIEEHAEAHRKLYELHGHWQDYLAGLISKEELIKQMLSEAGKRGAKGQLGKKRGKYKRHVKGDYKPVGTGGLKWYHNPNDPTEKGCFKEGQEIPKGWVLGQGKKAKNPGLNFHPKGRVYK